MLPVRRRQDRGRHRTRHRAEGCTGRVRGTDPTTALEVLAALATPAAEVCMVAPRVGPWLDPAARARWEWERDRRLELERARESAPRPLVRGDGLDDLRAALLPGVRVLAERQRGAR
ncbi:hypothetical protein [Streptomonospora nanhaiensis]|uniref:hypothetical protein n=1 Tax=Streptomonospora nanhaiensis TaxID=1323731 RepID=UPI001C38D1DF|nr:hypothetical protein [Streptomonospora nanhaiensis]MBV2366197.1 hypothetical protein [Streptomonospora nanhaiensis]